jgi:hypothetical protein
MPAKFSFALIVSVCLGCAANAASVEPTEFLDERTGATITVVHDPLVFAFERSSLAANARDYISLTAVEVDRSGQLQTYLIGYVWSTIDRRNRSSAPDQIQKPLALLADGREIQLVPVSEFPKDLLDEQRLLAPPASHVLRAAYPASRELLRYIASSRNLSISFALDSEDEDAERESYQIWGDGKKALIAFVERTDSFK